MDKKEKIFTINFLQYFLVWYFLTLKENWDECCLNTGKHTSKYIRPKDTPGSEVDSTIFSHKKIMSYTIQYHIFG